MQQALPDEVERIQTAQVLEAALYWRVGSRLEAARNAIDEVGLWEEILRLGLEDATHVDGVPAILHERRPRLRPDSNKH